jgi:ribosomal protein L7/L12
MLKSNYPAPRARVKTSVASVPGRLYPHSPSKTERAFMALLASALAEELSDRKISAIKIYRQVTGMGLNELKDTIETACRLAV